MNARVGITAAVFSLCGSIGLLSFSLASGQPNLPPRSEGNQSYVSAKTQETPTPVQKPTPSPSPSPTVTPTPVPEPEPVPTPTPLLR